MKVERFTINENPIPDRVIVELIINGLTYRGVCKDEVYYVVEDVIDSSCQCVTSHKLKPIMESKIQFWSHLNPTVSPRIHELLGELLI